MTKATQWGGGVTPEENERKGQKHTDARNKIGNRERDNRRGDNQEE